NVRVQVTINPGTIDRGRRASVLVLVTSPNGFPLAGRRVQLTSTVGRLDATTGVTDANGLFSTTIFIPCTVPDGAALTITAIVDGQVSAQAGVVSIVTNTSNDACEGI